ncbi:MAG: hypothetical protein WBG42_15675 [Cryomorphaceae bacterium]
MEMVKASLELTICHFTSTIRSCAFIWRQSCEADSHCEGDWLFFGEFDIAFTPKACGNSVSLTDPLNYFPPPPPATEEERQAYSQMQEKWKDTRIARAQEALEDVREKKR